MYLANRNIYGSSLLGQEEIHEVVASTDNSGININTNTDMVIGDKRYTLSNHLGSVYQVLTDRKTYNSLEDAFEETVMNYAETYPFGMLSDTCFLINKKLSRTNPYENSSGVMPNRSKTTIGNPRLGRWKSLDPLAAKAPGWTPYRTFFNNPIMYTDPDGRFETRKEARQYAKDNDINTNMFFGDSRIRKGKDGTFSIDNKDANSSIFRDKEFGVQDATLITGL